MIYTTPDGDKFIGATAQDVVTAMAAQKFVPPLSIHSYMKATAKRVHKMFGSRDDFVPIDSSNFESFLMTMEANELVKLVKA